LLDGFLFGLGMVDSRSFRHLGVAALLALAGSVAWEPVARQGVGTEQRRLLAWVGFPIAMLCALATIPFLAMSVHPGLEGWIFRVEARVDEPAGAMELSFPLPVAPAGINLRLGPLELPDAYVRKNLDAFRWTSPRVLRVDMARVLKDLAARRPSEVEINTVPGTPPFRYESGDLVPEQKVPLR